MRLYHLHRILVPLFLGVLLTAFYPAKMLSPLTNPPPQIMGAMEEYIEKIEGQWISVGQADQSDAIRVEVNRTWIYKDKVWIKVSEYCQPGIAEYLIFELKEDKLHYVAAAYGGHAFPLLYLDFMEILYTKEEGEEVLYLESSEAEMENHLNRRLIRVIENKPNPTSIL